MPRDLFGSVTDPPARRPTRKWSTVVLSFLAHACVLIVFLVIPLMATGALPVPKSGTMVMAVMPPPLPAPPPPPARRTDPPPAANLDAAPVVAPEMIVPEPEIDPGFEGRTGNESGIVGGIAADALDIVIAEPPPPPTRAPKKPFRPGGQIKRPDKIHDVPPVYPAIALMVGKEGVVIIEATIGVDGRVEDARVLRSVQLLDQAALDAVRQWIFTPTTLNGVPVPILMTVTVQFQLQR